MPDAGDSAVADDSDEALIGRYARGDAAAFELLYRRHEMRVWRYLQRNLRDAATADELMQEVRNRLMAGVAAMDPTEILRTWMPATAGFEQMQDFFTKMAGGKRDK